MTRPYGEQLGDALQDIINPPPPHIYFVKNVHELLKHDGWDRIEISVGRIVTVFASREENHTTIAMNQELPYHVLEEMKYPRHAVYMVVNAYRHGLHQWRKEH